MNYYNENDPFAAAWLRELIVEGLISDGMVDDRSIIDVRPADLRGFRQCHFFAGIGGWSYALRLAGVADDAEVWTGSCPCQPLSCAGLGKGHVDERHLWPAFYRLVAECRPPVVFGEQVASKAGREWFAGVRADLETLGYACGGLDLCAASVGAPHIRQRLYWVADSDEGKRRRLSDGEGCERNGHAAGREQGDGIVEPSGATGGVADSLPTGWPEGRPESGHKPFTWGGSIIPCTDGKARRIEPSIFPLASGVPNRVGTLCGAGNAIVPQVAAEFIRAAFEVIA